MRRSVYRGAISVRGVVALVVVLLMATLIQVLPHIGAVPAAVLNDRRTPVEVWGWNIAGESLGLLKPDFEAKHPDTRIDLKVVGTQMQSRFLLSLVSGQGAPDIMQLQEREAGKFTRTQRLADLTEVAGKYQHDFAPSFWDSCVVDGHVYAIPWDIAPCAVYYKRAIFEKYGVDPNAIETWDDLIAAGKTIVERSGGKTKMMPLAGNALASFFTMLLQQNGGGFFNAAGQIDFDTVPNRETLEQIRRLLDSGIGTPISDQNELNLAYVNDSVACFPGPSWTVGLMKDNAPDTKGQWGVFRLPAFKPGGVRNSNQGGSVLVLPASSEHREAAWQFVEYSLCTVDAQLQQYQKKGLFPAYIPAMKDPRFDQPDPFFGDQHLAKLLSTDIERVKPMIRTRDWMEAETIVGEALYEWSRDREDNNAWMKRVAKLLSDRLTREMAN